MPNHVTNRLRITGSVYDVRELSRFVSSDKMVKTWNNETIRCPFDFDKIIPQTKDVIKSLDDPDYYPKGWEKDLGWKPLFKTPWMSKPSEYWYEWRLKKWGTKWNSYDFTVDLDGNDGVFTIWFNTAWSAPHEVIRALFDRFPTVSIDHRWADEDIGRNCGIIKYRTVDGKKTLKCKDMTGHDRWCRDVFNRRIG